METPSNEPRSSIDVAREDEAEPPVVLIVEDERDLADLYAAHLEDTYTVRTAYTGKEALELLDDNVDVALLDRRLGTWSGDELLTVIHDRKIDCQVAMVTAAYPDFDIVDLAIDDYLRKPVSREELRGTVEELLLWRESDIDQQELLALISRRIVLENEKDEPELAASEEYSKLGRRIRIAKSRLDIGSDDISATASKYRPSACSQCGLRWDLSVGDTLGFLNLATSVWKCTGCGNIEKHMDPGDRQIVRR